MLPVITSAMWSNFNFEVYQGKFTLKRYILLGGMVVLTAIPAISQPSNQGSFKVITELIDSGRYERAENYAKGLFNTALVKNDLVEVALWRYYLGQIMIGLKKRDEALAYLLGAHQDSTLLDHHILLDVKLKLAQLYRENNDPETATSFYEQVLGWPGPGKDDRLWLAAMIGLGELYMEAKNYHKAIDCLEKAYQRSLRLSYHDELGKVFSRLTELYFDYGSFKDSKQLAIRTLQIAYNEQLNDLTMRAYYVL
ncbi:MAG: tetratricopeptide repeat protein, partial [Cytophagales bacterium]|nr:tetratricopeptide repeat protein [Cytophagales bacterium]